MDFIGHISKILSHPRIYLLNQLLVGGIRSRRVVIRDYVKPRLGLRVLDLGCGPGYTSAYFPKPEYYGFDVSVPYIDFANHQYASQGRFFAQLFDETALAWLPSIDVVLMLGLLHHLDDESCSRLLGLAKRAMSRDGRLFTLDGFYEPGQSRIARDLLDRDRGKFIRTQDGYVHLAKQVFGNVLASTRNDLFHVPYSALILECKQ